MFGSQVYKIVIGKQGSNGFTEIKRLKVNIGDNTKKWRGGSYFYTVTSFTHHKGRHHFAYFDRESADCITYGEIQSDINAEDSDTRDAKKMIKSAIQDFEQNYGLPMVILAGVAMLCLGLFIGFVAYPYINPAPQEVTHATVKAVLGVLPHA